jgi:hypothetical protein
MPATTSAPKIPPKLCGTSLRASAIAVGVGSGLPTLQAFWALPWRVCGS